VIIEFSSCRRILPCLTAPHRFTQNSTVPPGFLDNRVIEVNGRSRRVFHRRAIALRRERRAAELPRPENKLFTYKGEILVARCRHNGAFNCHATKIGLLITRATFQSPPPPPTHTYTHTHTYTSLPFVSMHVPVITLPIHCSNFIMLILGGIAPGYKRMHSSLSCPPPRLSHFVPAYPHRAGMEPQEPKNAAVVQFRPASTA